MPRPLYIMVDRDWLQQIIQCVYFSACTVWRGCNKLWPTYSSTRNQKQKKI